MPAPEMIGQILKELTAMGMDTLMSETAKDTDIIILI